MTSQRGCNIRMDPLKIFKNNFNSSRKRNVKLVQAVQHVQNQQNCSRFANKNKCSESKTQYEDSGTSPTSRQMQQENHSVHQTKCPDLKLNSMVWVRERTIPTERPPLVSEVIANFCGWRMPRGQRDGSLRP
jgi:hypothetical protein